MFCHSIQSSVCLLSLFAGTETQSHDLRTSINNWTPPPGHGTWYLVSLSFNLVLIHKIAITVQPLRFDILEELGCVNTVYSYAGYVIYYGPAVVTSLGCAVLARKSPSVAVLLVTF